MSLHLTNHYTPLHTPPLKVCEGVNADTVSKIIKIEAVGVRGRVMITVRVRVLVTVRVRVKVTVSGYS